MTNINITNFRKDIYDLLEKTIKFNEPINISTKNGNAVVISEEDYNNLMETLYISSIPELKTDIVNGLKEPLNECISEDEVEW
ncbi:MAG: type II toxin-antitoxin system Phd/YefM family antitoxin [Clostridia bacterium]|nr:type II toxin-antitoxin system Phd/YefM family antitoxin [Clostridia bacterium]